MKIIGWTALGKREHHDRVEIRRLGGDVSAELGRLQFERVPPFHHIDVELGHAVIDLMMGVLARHVDEVIVNDPVHPVAARLRPVYEGDWEPDWVIAEQSRQSDETR